MSDELDDVLDDDFLASMEGDAVEEGSEEDAGDDWGDALDEQNATESAAQPTAGDMMSSLGMEDDSAPKPKATAAAAPAQFQNLSAADIAGAADMNLDMVLDIPVSISMEIGRTKIPIRNLLQLNQGSVIELDRLAGETLDVLVNGVLIAHGEVVVVNDKFGIRITDIISPKERIKKIR